MLKGTGKVVLKAVSARFWQGATSLANEVSLSKLAVYDIVTYSSLQFYKNALVYF